jgi:hypothetical protein
LHIFASTWADSRCFFHLFIAGEVMLIPAIWLTSGEVYGCGQFATRFQHKLQRAPYMLHWHSWPFGSGVFFHEVFPCFFPFPNGLEIANLRVHRMWLNICSFHLFSCFLCFSFVANQWDSDRFGESKWGHPVAGKTKGGSTLLMSPRFTE